VLEDPAPLAYGAHGIAVVVEVDKRMTHVAEVLQIVYERLLATAITQPAAKLVT